eukprot:TRINITY_DN9000_c0_g1_i3.p1 TRINITY_DN9000_c0_g1~~TRINITY_DN9000_c0_g1_i3.p1  ORF type:complete len:309 (-),score=72.80 TRINITY_DN9000_c0_g1_i3:86-1012(-)
MGIYLSSPNKEKHTIEGASKEGDIRFVLSSMQGWRVQMEDAHIAVCDLASNIHIFGVFDGHGGKEVAVFVERHFIEELLKTEDFKFGRYEAALRRTFLRMDELLDTPEGKRETKIIRREEGKDEFGGDDLDSFAGCTAIVVLIVGRELFVANAGDSRAVLRRGKKIVELSTDHKPDLERERERILRAGGTINDGRINGNLNLSRALGDLEYKKNKALSVEEQLIIAVPEIKRERLTSEDTFILVGCDGIWESHTAQELLDEMDARTRRIGPKRAVEEIMDSLLAPETTNGIGCDNMSAIIILISKNYP